MRFVFAIVVSLLATSFAFAASCPDLSGKYEMPENSHRVYELEFKQTGCEKLTIRFAQIDDGKVDHEREDSYVADGVFRSIRNSERFIYSSASHFTSDQFVETGLNYMYDQDKQNWEVITDLHSYSLNESGDLVESMQSFDALGNARNSEAVFIIKRKK